MADTKRLAKNTLFMYVRMLLIMVVGIYTSRVVLDKLGVDDYGLYNAVATIVAIVVFLNTTLSTSTSRFLTYQLGEGDMGKLKNTFSTALYSHLILAVIMLLLLETIGLWYISNKFVIPDGRELAVHAVFQISVLTTMIAVVQVPYTASIMAHENMDVYAYVGIFDVVARLGIVYLLKLSPIDNLIFYAILVAVVQLMTALIYISICHHKYKESHLIRHFNSVTFKGMIRFTGWTAVANLSNTFVVQGAVVLLNLFFSPAVIAAKALANQVTMAIMQFVNNFRVALNPQIIKSYAARDFADFKKWCLRSASISSNLLLILSLPCIVTMNAILNIWLVEIPEQALEFIQLAIFCQVIESISSATYIAFVASGKIKSNALLSTFTGGGYFIVLYCVFKFGGGALWVQWLYLLLSLLSVFVFRPYLLHKEVGFTYIEVYKSVWDCFKPIVSASLLSYGLSVLFGESLWQQILLFFSVTIVTGITVWLFMEKAMRAYILNIIKTKLHSV